MSYNCKTLINIFINLSSGGFLFFFFNVFLMKSMVLIRILSPWLLGWTINWAGWKDICDLFMLSLLGWTINGGLLLLVYNLIIFLPFWKCMSLMTDCDYDELTHCTISVGNCLKIDSGRWLAKCWSIGWCVQQ